MKIQKAQRRTDRWSGPVAEQNRQKIAAVHASAVRQHNTELLQLFTETYRDELSKVKGDLDD